MLWMIYYRTTNGVCCQQQSKGNSSGVKSRENQEPVNGKVLQRENWLPGMSVNTRTLSYGNKAKYLLKKISHYIALSVSGIADYNADGE